MEETLGPGSSGLLAAAQLPSFQRPGFSRIGTVGNYPDIMQLEIGLKRGELPVLQVP